MKILFLITDSVMSSYQRLKLYSYITALLSLRLPFSEQPSTRGIGNVELV